MTKTGELLQTEDAVASLLAELERLKSATDEIEDAKDRSQAVVGAAQEVVQHSGQVMDLAVTVLKVIQDLDLPRRMAAQDQELAAAAERQASLTQSVELIRSQMARWKKVTVGLLVCAVTQVLAVALILLLLLRG
jgi:hypothetical protein